MKNKEDTVRSIHGAMVDYELPEMNCGGIPLFDTGAGYGYRCDMCNAVIGSVAQSDECKEMNK